MKWLKTMSVAISPSDRPAGGSAPRQGHVHGVGRVGYRSDGDSSARLSDLYQSDPVRVLFPWPGRDEIPAAAFVTTSGGLVGGDVVELQASAEENVRVRCYPQAAEKIYRSAGPDTHFNVTLSAGANSWLEWLPQESILFDGGRLRRHTSAHVDIAGRLFAGEMLVLGRGAMGEVVRHGLLRDTWSVYRGKQLVWADNLHLEDNFEDVVNHPAGLAGARAVATAIYVAEDAEAYLSPAREILRATATGVRAGVSLVNGLLLVRFMSESPAALRASYGQFWAHFRHLAAGLPATLPRLWHI